MDEVPGSELPDDFPDIDYETQSLPLAICTCLANVNTKCPTHGHGQDGTTCCEMNDDSFSNHEHETRSVPLYKYSCLTNRNQKCTSHGEASTSNTTSPQYLIGHFVGMGFPRSMVTKAVEENGESNMEAILESLLIYSSSTSGTSQSTLICHFVGMGFPKSMVTKAIKENGEVNMEAILETLLTYSTLKKSPSESEFVQRDTHSSVCEDDSPDYFSDGYSYVRNKEDFEHLLEKDTKMLQLVDMGFPVEEASSAIDACGPNTTVVELMDFICASQMAKEAETHLQEPPSPISDYAEGSSHNHEDLPAVKKRKRLFEEENSWEAKLDFCARDNESKKNRNRLFADEVDEGIHIPKPMIGFGVPMQSNPLFRRTLPEAALGPPYFYYENVACTPKGTWDSISRFLYEIQPEFVDSVHFCAAARKRGYVHNLPIHNRYPLQPIPPLTIQDALPQTKRWWPSWDCRTKLNCLSTSIASAKTTDEIRKLLEPCDDFPPLVTQKYVLCQCRKWNLVWMGKYKVAALEPDEIEMLLGFPINHTRGGGTNKTDRYRALGNSFQVDTVAFHFSVLKNIFPNGITVLSLFSGIGGAEVALHRLGIPLKNVVSVEILEVNRNILRCWWEQTNQRGNLIELEDVQELTTDKLEKLVRTLGGFDLIVGGSPCNNLTGHNRCSRDGLQGQHSILFYDYFRILKTVRCIMGNN